MGARSSEYKRDDTLSQSLFLSSASFSCFYTHSRLIARDFISNEKNKSTNFRRHLYIVPFERFKIQIEDSIERNAETGCVYIRALLFSLPTREASQIAGLTGLI